MCCQGNQQLQLQDDDRVGFRGEDEAATACACVHGSPAHEREIRFTN
jgi:hypothetical protein